MQQPDARIEQDLERAGRHRQLGALPHAEQAYRQIIETHPDVPDPYLRLSEVLAQQGKLAEATSTLEAGVGQVPDSGDLLAMLGSMLASRGDLERGSRLVEKAVQVDPDSATAQAHFANVLSATGRMDEALTASRRSVELDPDNLMAWTLLGNLLSATGNTDEGIEAFRRVTELAPQFAPAQAGLGGLLTHKGRYDDALVAHEAARSVEPGNPEHSKNVGMVLHVTGRLAEAEEAFRNALGLHGGDPDAHVLLGNVLRDQGRLTDASAAYRAALELRPGITIAQENLRKIDATKIPGWHFEMLADTARNQAFDRAIRKAVTPGATVLDIGTGSGLLAMMAARAGAGKVVACEAEPDLARVARRVVRDNGFEDRIEVIAKRSVSLRVGDDMTERADVLVSEILDVGVLGEGVVPSVRHARENLVKPGAVVIPKSAQVHAVLVESEPLARINPVREIAGFDLHAFDEFRLGGPYIALKLDESPHRLLSDVSAVVTVDLANPLPPTPVTEPRVRPWQVRVTRDGTLHAVAFWFDLHLDDEITVSSGPDGDLKHWGQAVCILDRSPEVRKGQDVSVRVLLSDTRIEFELA